MGRAIFITYSFDCSIVQSRKILITVLSFKSKPLLKHPSPIDDSLSLSRVFRIIGRLLAVVKGSFAAVVDKVRLTATSLAAQ